MSPINTKQNQFSTALQTEACLIVRYLVYYKLYRGNCFQETNEISGYAEITARVLVNWEIHQYRNSNRGNSFQNLLL